MADDERIIREGISRMVDWKKHGTILSGTAVNGQEAYNFIVSHPPHIVITDIKMPGLGGLELLAKVKNDHPGVEFVILSGYGEFEFASKAMQHGVEYFLVKPCSEQRIGLVLDKVVAKLRKREAEEARLRIARENAQKLLSSLKDTDLEELAEVARRISQTLQANEKDPNDEPEQSKRCSQIQMVIEAVRKNLSNENLSLKWLARELLYMNEDYLGKLFRREMNERFTEYVNRIRVRRAKQIMDTNRDCKVYEVAAEVGFADNPQYFSRVFRKYTGYTPSEYRERLHGRD